MPYAVKATGLDTQGPYDTEADAEKRVRELTSQQFPASIWEMPEGQDFGSGHLVREYASRP